MRYFVIYPDGTRYGPADLHTLNQWASERRLDPTMMLEEEVSGTQMMASTVLGLYFPAGASPVPPQGEFGGAAYTRPGQFNNADGILPEQFRKKFNWGAFYFSWIWGLNHKAYLTLVGLGLSALYFALGYGRTNSLSPILLILSLVSMTVGCCVLYAGLIAVAAVAFTQMGRR
ncbi:MAG: hypothetical protein K8R88_00075 [Armatimonadetes bacterium]|nr:hypothetical protein [Armatimonadota bacterium]